MMMPFRSCNGVWRRRGSGGHRRSHRPLERGTGADRRAIRTLDPGRIGRHARTSGLIGALAREWSGDRANEAGGAGDEGLTP